MRASLLLSLRNVGVTLVTVVVMVTVLLTTVALAGPEGGAVKMRTSADVVETSVTPAAVTAHAGERVAFKVNVQIEKKWHLYAHEDTMFIGVDLVPSETFPLVDLKVDYPAGHEGTFFGEKVQMLEGAEVISASAQLPADLPVGETTLDLALTVQACDDKMCLAPAYIPVTVKLTVE